MPSVDKKLVVPISYTNVSRPKELISWTIYHELVQIVWQK
ncbi:hypothetical protein VIC_001839 [Vibrio coralliilyticus ATCC BAA-450]|nr:hypothetical protein VIC_001839 [Vibrio coralliilyticus ATCC BAA-450]